MRYELKAYAIQDIGQRGNQEDSFYPPFIAPVHFDKTDREEAYIESVPHTDDTLFILCDGMGGHSHGEVASSTVCEVMSTYITDAEREGKTFDDDMLQEAIDQAHSALTEKEAPETERKMGCTLTLLKIQDHGATIAHVGDSRVYHFRPQHEGTHALCLFCTKDHSYGNMFPNCKDQRQKRALVRAMIAYADDECRRADIHHTNDILPGDVFFLCSDGILEELYDEDLCRMLTNNKYTDEERIRILMTFCKGNRDNHTAWFVRVVSRDGETYTPPATQTETSPLRRILDSIKSWISKQQ